MTRERAAAFAEAGAERAGGRVRLLLAEDDHSVREALAEAAELFPDVQIVGVAADAQRTIEMAQALRPDVVLVDVSMPAGGGLRATEEIRRLCPETRVLVFSAAVERETIGEMLRAGAAGYIVKGASLDELFGAVRSVARGGSGGLSEDALAQLMPADHGDGRAASDSEAARRIRKLLDDDRLYSVYQPIVDLETGRIVALEALARFRGTSAPVGARFVEAASVGLLIELELSALRAALPALGSIPEHVRLSVNLSPETITSERLTEVLADVPVNRLVIEVTEQSPIDDHDRLLEALGSLRARGAHIAVDDAGSGHATLRRVSRLSPDIVKVDLSLVRDIDKDEVRRTVVASLVPFVKRMGASVVAEGIETPSELRAVRELGVGHGQGFLLAEPAELPEGPDAWPDALPADGPVGPGGDV